MTSNQISRRDWLKTVSLAVVLPFVPRHLSAGLSPADKKAEGAHRVVTCNILLDLPEHKEKMSWKAFRKDLCIKVIKAQNADIICLQEVGPSQNQDFLKAFPDFSSFGFEDPASDKNPPRFQSIRNVILFSKERYEMVTTGKYWLSETPHIVGSKLEGENLARHVSWVRLKDKQTRREFRVLNTHWATIPVRVRQAEIVASETTQYPSDFPQLISGDFNAEYDTAEIAVLRNAGWIDSYISTTPSEGQFKGRKIDFVFCRGSIRPVASKIIDVVEEGVRPSDHFFVSADVLIQ